MSIVLLSIELSLYHVCIGKHKGETGELRINGIAIGKGATLAATAADRGCCCTQTPQLQRPQQRCVSLLITPHYNTTASMLSPQ